MAASRCTLRFDRGGTRVGLDCLDLGLASARLSGSHCDFFAHKVSKGAAILFNSSIGVALLGSLCGVCLSSTTSHLLYLHGQEALICQARSAKYHASVA